MTLLITRVPHGTLPYDENTETTLEGGTTVTIHTYQTVDQGGPSRIYFFAFIRYDI